MKSNVKRVKGKNYYFWNDCGEIEKDRDFYQKEDDYRHSVGNYFEREEDVVEPSFHEIYGVPEEEEKFMQMDGCYGLTNKGRLFQWTGDKWRFLSVSPDFKNIK